MDGYTVDDLHAIRIVIFDNAESLYKEALLLQENGHAARSYLLAHFCCEELGKIPIVVGAIGRLYQGESVDWPKFRRRFRDHRVKIDSDDYHQYVWGKELDYFRETDLKWYADARSSAADRVRAKNDATYVDVSPERVSTPLKAITSEDARAAIARAFDSLKAHWHAESLTNPIIVESNRKADMNG